ncbi:hypothetical protein VN97_g11796 [Penicillium thymicola]|uniref:Uncharacterized protein n=1 Tax=Penicillium thymicola TaxID=293382 RepID=A0AAI9T7A7_PENTH|nr:hypothetical protein VN97_g11796 [Penicillium thymicola]
MLTYNKGERIADANMRLMRLDPTLDKYERSFEIFRRAFRVWTEADLIEHIRAALRVGIRWLGYKTMGQKPPVNASMDKRMYYYRSLSVLPYRYPSKSTSNSPFPTTTIIE